MKVLLDTHILLWALADDERLPQKAREIILQGENEIYYSTVSVWEVSIKHSLHPEQIPISGHALSGYCRKAGYQTLPLWDEHAWALETITRPPGAPRHNDPFDRMLIAQAKSEGMLFVTHDALLPYYNETCIIAV
ncbi:MAG: type II toxin-antitoxin system VapC family toxin [Lachnospiraceae bacterium]|nr:type II toxin-antitoxin system VapC family toxin [Lachnospiraceae bacterium]